MDNTPREEIDFAALYGNLLTPQTPLYLETFDSRVGQTAIARLPFPVDKSGFTWKARLEEARESLPRASFRPTRPRIYSQSQMENSISVLTLEVPQKRGRGRPRKQSTAVVDAASATRNSFFVKKSYSHHGADDTRHNPDSYKLHGHGGANVATDRIGIVLPERYYLRNLSQTGAGVEYDLDDQDFEWLKLVNSGKEGLYALNEAQLERIIEELELGWATLTQPLRRLQQRKEAAQYMEEMPCEICGESDTSNCNVIVICDDCDLVVHQECYGIPHIPEGPWLCRTCNDRARSNYTIKPKCLMCPWPNSALRKTQDHRWVHSLCAHMIPETAITFTPSDPNDLVDVCALQSDRAKLRCVLCRVDHARGGGYPMQCASKLCPVAFHPLCARAAGWILDFAKQKAYCCRHAPEASIHENVTIDESAPSKSIIEKSNQLVMPVDLESMPTSRPSSPRSSGSGSPKKVLYPQIQITENPPLHHARVGGEKLRLQTVAPAVLIEYIVNLEDIFDANISSKMRREWVQRVARYWSLKRESRRGTPLLKTLQLEPCWTDSTETTWNREQFETELQRKTELLHELHRLRDLLWLFKEREELKAEIVRDSNAIFEILSQPFSRLCEHFVRHLMINVDPAGYFHHPVPIDIFPDYPAIVKCPMDFSTILKNLAADRKSTSCDPEKLFYPSLAHFYADLKLIPENSRLFNTTTSVFYLAADRLEAYMQQYIVVLHDYLASFGVKGPFDSLNLENPSVKEQFNLQEFLDSLPDPTPMRFESQPKTSMLPNRPQASSTSSSNSSLVAFGTVKRRGRPPKNRDGLSSSGSSSNSNSNSGSSDSIVKASNRPRMIVCESEDDEKSSSKAGKLDLLCWARVDDEHWWPARIVDPNDESEEIPANLKRMRPRAQASFTLVQAFDPQRQWHWIAKSDITPLSEDFETDLESLDVRSLNRKQLASAHRAALESVL